jgi:hypothetical protein
MEAITIHCEDVCRVSVWLHAVAFDGSITLSSLRKKTGFAILNDVQRSNCPTLGSTMQIYMTLNTIRLFAIYTHAQAAEIALAVARFFRFLVSFFCLLKVSLELLHLDDRPAEKPFTRHITRGLTV